MTLVRDLIDRASKREAPGLLSPTRVDVLSSLFGIRSRQTAAGITVTRDRALSLTALFACCRLIASTAGSLPIVVSNLGPNREKEPVYADLDRVIWDKPNPEVSREIFWETAFFHAALTGNAYLYVVPAMDSPRRPVQLWPIEPHRITDIRRDDRGRKLYTIDGEIPATDWIAGGQIVHVPALGYDGLKGLSPISVAAEAIANGLAAQEYAGRRFGNASDPGGYLSTDQPLSAAQADEAVEAWEETHRGLENAHRTAILGRGTKWMTTTMNPEDAQLLQSREWSAGEMAQLYGVPPHMIGLVSKSTSWGSGIEEQGRGFVTYTLNPWLLRFSGTISDELLRPRNRVCEFNTQALVRGRLVDQVTAVGNLIRVGFDAAESLKAVGLDPIAHTGLPPVGSTALEPPPTPDAIPPAA